MYVPLGTVSPGHLQTPVSVRRERNKIQGRNAVEIKIKVEDTARKTRTSWAAALIHIGIPNNSKQFIILLVGVSANRKLPNFLRPEGHTYSDRRSQDSDLFSWHRLFKEPFLCFWLLFCGSDRIDLPEDLFQ